METRRNRTKKVKYDQADYKSELGDISDSNDQESLEDLRKSRIRDSNKEYARRMTILQSWSDHWSDYTTREGEAYPKKEVLQILKKSKKVLCPIESCRKAFTTFGGLRYHYARCNIERCFKCNVCNPPSELKTKGDLLRHMIRGHYNDMPALDDEQKEIAQCYLVSTGRAEKSKKKYALNDNESHMNYRGMIRSFYEIADKVIKIDANQDNRPYREWLTLNKDWTLIVHESERHRYYPPEKESPHIKISPNKWQVLKTCESFLFDSHFHSLNNSSNEETNPTNHISTRQASDEPMANSLFFTGGVSTSAAWLPKPLADEEAQHSLDLVAVSINCCPMDKSLLYKDCKDLIGCVQFWTVQIASTTATATNALSSYISTKPELAFMIGHNWGNIFDMVWCPLGASWQKHDKQQFNADTVASSMKHDPDLKLKRCGILALACGDGNIRLVSVPHVEYLKLKSSLTTKLVKSPVECPIDSAPMYSVKPIACLTPPGAGQSTDYSTPACTSICWNLEDDQRILAAGYSNGAVALFDLSNFSPILYSSAEHYQIYRPFKTWFAHAMPVSGVGLLSDSLERILVATGSRDRQLKVWNSQDLNSCLASDRSPITRIIWDYRFRGIVSSTEAAFTSFQNRVSYRYPTLDGPNTTLTIATHRATVWGLNNSILTSSLATSDEAGEVIVSIYGRPIQKKERNLIATHSVFTLLPRARHSCDQNDLNRLHEERLIDRVYQQINSTSSSNFQQVTSADQLMDDGTVQGIGGDTVLSAANTNAQTQFGSNEHELVITLPMAENDPTLGAINTHGLNLEDNNNDEENQHEDVYGITERPVANKPARFLLPIEHRAVETYGDFKQNFGLEFVDYDQTYPRNDQRLPDSCTRASDLAQIYCDRVCDYPFSSIKHVSFSPNSNSFPYLMSVSHVGLCRLGKVNIIEHFYRSHVETTLNSASQQQQAKQCQNK